MGTGSPACYKHFSNAAPLALVTITVSVFFLKSAYVFTYYPKPAIIKISKDIQKEHPWSLRAKRNQYESGVFERVEQCLYKNINNSLLLVYGLQFYENWSLKRFASKHIKHNIINVNRI